MLSPIKRSKLRLQTREQTATGIFINEDLTKTRGSLLFKARKAKKTDKIMDRCSADGQIIIKNKACKLIPIHNSNDLRRITHEEN